MVKFLLDNQRVQRLIPTHYWCPGEAFSTNISVSKCYCFDLIFLILSRTPSKHPVIFGGKAAPAYVAAQDIIHAILVLSLITHTIPSGDNDRELQRYCRWARYSSSRISLSRFHWLPRRLLELPTWEFVATQRCYRLHSWWCKCEIADGRQRKYLHVWCFKW